MNKNNLSKLLSEIKARAEKATPGPWFDNIAGTDITALEKIIEDTPLFFKYEDAKFISHARTDVPRLVEALKKAIEQRNDFIRLYMAKIGNDRTPGENFSAHENCNDAEILKMMVLWQS